MWKHINQLVGKGSKTTHIRRIKVNDSVFTKNEDIANIFNTYFAQIGENLSSQIPQTNVCIDEFIEPVSAFELNHLVIDDVKKVIRLYIYIYIYIRSQPKKTFIYSIKK